MIAVHARLLRGSVFLAGETLECQITFTHVVNDSTKHLQSSSPRKQKKVEHLAWASGQINCQCTVSEARVKLPHHVPVQSSSSDSSSSTRDTAFMANKGENGMTVLSTTPQILFCDLKLSPGESKTFTYREMIPKDAPPTFKGHSVKYAYKLTIGTQRLESPTKLLRIPFRVLVLNGLNDLSVYTEQEEVAPPTNPFHQPKQQEHSVLDVGLEVLSTVTGRTKPISYNITNARGKVCQVCFFKQAYKLGEDIIATFDFTDQAIPCVQYSVSLQSEEQLAEECRQSSSQPITTLASYTKHHEFCLHMKRSHMSLPVPLSVTPSFITDLVTLRWKLHFEFTTSREPIPRRRPSDTRRESMGSVDPLRRGSTSRAPPTLDVETMVWDMPVKLFATNPNQANASSLLKTQAALNV